MWLLWLTHVFAVDHAVAGSNAIDKWQVVNAAAAQSCTEFAKVVWFGPWAAIIV